MAIGLNFLFTLGLVLAMANIGKVLGPRSRHEGDADMPFETGELPMEPAVEHMAVLYYRFAVLFVVFDVDLAFLLPWALNRGSLDLEQMLTMSGFVALVAFMLAYFWRKGVLECQ
jgi:NADH-quinone oxidoreductase subunit A